MSKEICYFSAGELRSAYTSGSLSPVECCAAMLDRIEAINPVVNAYFHVDHEGARKTARESEKRWQDGAPLGPLDGIPVSLKDHILTRDMPSPWGLKAVGLDGPWLEDAPVTARLREDGAIILGKTTQPEMAAFCSTVSGLYGVGRNPWDLAKTPGGSSGGAAAALAAGLCTIAIGSDGGGSIRNPASYVGIFGFKPSFGRVPFYPPMGPGPVYGPMTRNVTDAAIAMNTITRADWRDLFSPPYDDRDYTDGLNAGIEGLSIGYCRSFGFGIETDSEVAASVDNAVENLKSLGARVIEIDPLFDYNLYNVLAPGFFPPFALQIQAMAGAGMDLILPELQELVRRASAVDIAAVFGAKMLEAQATLKIVGTFKDFDLVVTPTMPTTAYDAEALFPDDVTLNELGYCFDHNPFTWPFNLTLQPAASIPCGMTAAGLPIGLQIAGQRHDDFGVLRAARAYEAAFPVVRAWPDL